MCMLGKMGDGFILLIYKALAFSRYKRFAKPKKTKFYPKSVIRVYARFVFVSSRLAASLSKA